MDGSPHAWLPHLKMGRLPWQHTSPREPKPQGDGSPEPLYAAETAVPWVPRSRSDILLLDRFDESDGTEAGYGHGV